MTHPTNDPCVTMDNHQPVSPGATPRITDYKHHDALCQWARTYTCGHNDHGLADLTLLVQGFIERENTALLARLKAAEARVGEAERLRKENDILRGLLPRVGGVKCPYCGLEDMGKCASGFPGCSWADDLMAGDDTHSKSLVDRLAAATERVKAVADAAEVEAKQLRDSLTKSEQRADALARECEKAKTATIEKIVRKLENDVNEYVHEHASYDPDTGQYEYGEAVGQRIEELEARVNVIRAYAKLGSFDCLKEFSDLQAARADCAKLRECAELALRNLEAMPDASPHSTKGGIWSLWTDGCNALRRALQAPTAKSEGGGREIDESSDAVTGGGDK